MKKIDDKKIKGIGIELDRSTKLNELTCDYGFSYDQDYKQFPCNCGSNNCCGYIVRAESRWRINRKFSLGHQKNFRINK